MEINRKKRIMITVEKFIAAYESYPPTKNSLFFHKYFSGDNVLPENEWVSRSYQTFLIIMFLVGMFGAIINQMGVAKVFGLILTGALLLLGIPFIFTWFQHARRITKIRKKLGVTKLEYEKLVRKYGYLVK